MPIELCNFVSNLHETIYVSPALNIGPVEYFIPVEESVIN